MATSPSTFNILSIGHRGVGKTVFLAGSYAQLQTSQVEEVWFEGQDEPSQQRLLQLLDHVATTGQYPPATLKITEFKFTAKTKKGRREKDLCQFHWSDIPGEICHLDNPEFKEMLLNSHACCTFVDANALVNDEEYLEQIEETIKQVEVIASLARQSQLQYIFALILTKCDLLEAGPAKMLAIEKKLLPFKNRLEAANTQYRQFLSSIPIVKGVGLAQLQAEGSAQSLLWLVRTLAQTYGLEAPKSLAGGLNEVLANDTRSLKERAGLQGPWWSKPLPLIGFGLVGVGIVAAIGLGPTLLQPTGQNPEFPPDEDPVASRAAVAKDIQDLEAQLEQDSQNPKLLEDIIDRLREAEEYKKALTYMDRLIEIEPKDVNLRFQQAGLQSLLGRRDLEEAAYDQILNLEGDNVMALTNKAILRSAAGDITAAKKLFDQAEESAPEGELKQTIRDVAQQWLDLENPPSPN